MGRLASLLWPRGLAGRTVLLLLASLTGFHLGSLWLHRHEGRYAAAELGEARVAERLVAAGRAVAALPAEERDHVAHSLSGPGLNLSWNPRSLIAYDAPPGRAGPAAALFARLVEAEPAYAAGRLADATDGAVPTIRGGLPAGGGLRGGLPGGLHLGGRARQRLLGAVDPAAVDARGDEGNEQRGPGPRPGPGPGPLPVGCLKGLLRTGLDRSLYTPKARSQTNLSALFLVRLKPGILGLELT